MNIGDSVMISTTKKIDRIFKSLYNSEHAYIKPQTSFEKIIESNQSRIDYLIDLFDKIEENNLNDECKKIFKDNIEFLHDFITGKHNKEIPIPNKYFKDKEDNLIIPNSKELDYLFKLLEANKQIYDIFYNDRKFIIDLPKNTFNQNMKRILEVKEYNLAHLLGLTDTEPEPDQNKNILKKYFLSNIKNTEQYGEKISERLLNWILSEEGQKEIIRLNNITQSFIIEDRKNYPNAYDNNGIIKQKALEKFKIRFKEANGFNFPIIKFSRCMTKCINTLNFLNMNNIYQMILDYNAPDGKKDEKDIFIINCPKALMMRETKEYVKMNKDILCLLSKYSDNSKILKNKIKALLSECGIDFEDKDILSLINIMQTKNYIEHNDINPNRNQALNKIREAINKYFKRNIHLVGFDTNIGNKIVDLNEFIINGTHCDTSISLTAAELVGEYYERGRTFFLDKIYDEEGNLIRISNPIEEMEYIELMQVIENKFSDLNILEEKLGLFKEKYKKYNNTKEKEKNNYRKK